MSSSPYGADEFECARGLDHSVHPNPVLRVTGKVRRRNSVEVRDKFCDLITGGTRAQSQSYFAHTYSKY
jgi:hypothetical protein